MSNRNFENLSQQGFGFAVFPEVRIFDEPDGKSIQHLIFGDYISPPLKSGGKGYKKWTSSLLRTVNDIVWINIRSRQEEGWIRLEEIQLQRTLEINFVDIGQGDGCHLVTPSDDHFIIDAGEGDNMYRFLRWRFNLANLKGKLPNFYAMISHPDEDHWKGFEWLLSKPPRAAEQLINFKKLFHNGIIQRAGSTIGRTEKINGERYLVDFIRDQPKLMEILSEPGTKSNYQKFLSKALKRSPDLKIETAYREISKPSIIYKDGFIKLEILAPIPEKINNKLMLRWFDPSTKAIGKTKNGHSIVMMAGIGKMKILVGGDLNSKSADYLMEKYSNEDIRALRIEIERAGPDEIPPLKEKMDELVAACRLQFEAEVTKSCHHGSHDITNEFLQAINPIATIISSGDEESFCHPRPETLGAIGKYGRGDRPLIFSTELARSSPEFINLQNKKYKTDNVKQRIVSTYGMITLRSDGKNTIIAQKLEKNSSLFGLITKWHIDKIIWNDERGAFVSKK